MYHGIRPPERISTCWGPMSSYVPTIPEGISSNNTQILIMPVIILGWKATQLLKIRKTKRSQCYPDFAKESVYGAMNSAKVKCWGKFAIFLQVSKSQKHFFLNLHCPKNEQNIRQNLVLWRWSRILSNISFFWGAMEVQEKMLLRFTDL